MIDCGSVPKFVALLGSKAQNVAEQSVWALGNIAGDGSEARDIVLHNQVAEYLMRLLSSDKIEVIFLLKI